MTQEEESDDEEDKAQRRADRVRVEAAGNRQAGGRGDVTDGDLGADLLRWNKVYSGLGIGELRRMKLLEEENRKLKQLAADLSLNKHILQDVLSKKL